VKEEKEEEEKEAEEEEEEEEIVDPKETLEEGTCSSLPPVLCLCLCLALCCFRRMAREARQADIG